jgi:hypothetical protein
VDKWHTTKIQKSPCEETQKHGMKQNPEAQNLSTPLAIPIFFMSYVSSVCLKATLGGTTFIFWHASGSKQQAASSKQQQQAARRRLQERKSHSYT